MRKFIAFVVLAASLGLIGACAVAPQLFTRGLGGATALSVAGGLLTVALAAHVRD
jgi:hypothetical protein